jgi:hypothetical protein
MKLLELCWPVGVELLRSGCHGVVELKEEFGGVGLERADAGGRQAQARERGIDGGVELGLAGSRPAPDQLGGRAATTGVSRAGGCMTGS